MPLGNRKYAGEGYVQCHEPPLDEDGQPTGYHILGVLDVVGRPPSPWVCVDHVDTFAAAMQRVSNNTIMSETVEDNDMLISWDFAGPGRFDDDMPPM